MAAPQATDDYQARLAALLIALLVAGRRAWRRMGPGRPLEQQFSEDVGPKLALLVMAGQIAAARSADDYAAAVLEELDFGPSTSPGVLRPSAFAGFAGNGRPAIDLLGSSVGRVRALQGDNWNLEDALREAEAFVEAAIQTIITDTARAAEEAALAARPWVAGYVRVAEPGACSRCLVLTGKFYRFNDGFLRHPRCRCCHVPAPDDRAALDRLMSSETPERRFEALAPEEQDRTFGEAGAKAIREGADISRVVNARRGMKRAQVYGRDVLVTTAGTRGRRRTNGPRLMPEVIFDLAGDDRDEAIRLLRLYGYIN